MSTSTTAAPATRPVRVAKPRRYLMCPPAHFDVTYSINPWMHPEKPTDQRLAMVQWDRLRSLYLGLGHQVEQIPARGGLPDMVFAANGATVVNGRVLSANFRHAQRRPEGPAYLEWFREHGFHTRDAYHVNEGEGDYLVTASRILAGTGFRTDVRSHTEAAEFFHREVISLSLVDPRFYHLDTALAVLDGDDIMYYPKAFSADSQATLARLYPDAIRADEHDAAVFGLNAVSDGRHVLLAEQATGLIEQLWLRGFVPIGVDLSELMKSGGSAKCCTLELRAAL